MAEENEARDPFEEARHLYDDHKYSEAASAYQGLMDSGDKTAPVYLGLGQSLYKLRRYEEAIVALNESIRLDPTEADAYNELGETFYDLRKFQDAINIYQAAANIYRNQASDARAASLAAAQCSSSEKKKEAKDKRLEAQQADEGYSDRYNDLAFAYLSINEYDEAIAKARDAIDKAEQYPYAYHALASVLWTQGSYKDAMKEWKKAKTRYKNLEQTAKAKRWYGHFVYFGNLLHEVFGELDEAERVYGEGLKLDENDLRSWIGLVALYLERKDDNSTKRNKACRDADGAYKKAKKLIITRNADDVESLLMEGELALAMMDYDVANTSFEMALRKDESQKSDERYMRSAKPNTDLGILCMRRKQFKEAIRYFDAAREIDSDDLSLRSNLAEAYLRDDQLEEAEREFQRVLQCAPDHIESRIGLGGVYTALAETGEPDMYDAAIFQYSEAMRLAKQKCGSRRLKKNELALVYYSMGYARVKAYEASRTMKDLGRLHDARADFRECFKNDGDQHKAQRAVEKIDKVLPPRSPHRFMEEWGPFVILLCSAAVFLTSQFFFVLSFLDKAKLPSSLRFLDQAQHLATSVYVPVTFGSLILMVTSCYLPQLLKIKVPGIEMEKTAVDQITTLGPVGVSRPT